MLLRRSLPTVLCSVVLVGACTGEAGAAVVADNGFRPDPNGFSFENYGGDSGFQNLTSSEMQRLFGKSVCANHATKPIPEPAPAPVNPNGGGGGSNGGGKPSPKPGPGEETGPGEPVGDARAFAGDPAQCDLTPDAQDWMSARNNDMNGGHCNGFSVLSAELYKKQSPFESFGSGPTFSYKIQGNTRLQRALAYAFVYQNLASVVTRRLHADADTIVAKLQTALTAGDPETYTLGIYKPDGSDGHAITPYAVEDLGGGMKAIDVYDNNYPGEARQVLVNTVNNTWSYNSAPNPSSPPELYGPSASDSNLEIDPTTPGEGVQPPEFGKAGGSVGGSGASAAAASKLDTVTLEGGLHHHAHLVINDGPGHQVGVVMGRIVNTFPGAYVQPVLQFTDYFNSQEPVYLIPSRDVKMTIDGTALGGHSDTETLSDVGDGQDVDVQHLKVNSGQKDTLQFKKGAANMSFSVAKGKSAGSPTLRIGADTSASDVALKLKVVNIHPGATIHVKVNEKKQTITFFSTGNRGAQKFTLSAVKETKKATFDEGTDTVTLHGQESVTYSYSK